MYTTALSPEAILYRAPATFAVANSGFNILGPDSGLFNQPPGQFLLRDHEAAKLVHLQWIVPTPTAVYDSALWAPYHDRYVTAFPVPAVEPVLLQLGQIRQNLCPHGQFREVFILDPQVMAIT